MIQESLSKETLSDLMDYTKIVYIDPNYPEKNNSEKLDTVMKNTSIH